jgi:hypothetical protein
MRVLAMNVKLMVVRSFPTLLLLSLAALPHAHAASQTPAAPTPQEAQALVARALATESRAAQEFGTSYPMRYRLHKVTAHLTSTKELVETRDGDVARLLSLWDKPLSQADEQKEQARLDALLSDPSLQQHRKKSEDADTARAMNVLRVLPQAFLYQFAGTGMAAGGMVEKFTFVPNPQFSPPDLETQLLTAMTGELWIDAAQERVVRLEGHLQQNKEFGLGILGQVDKGGWVLIEQADVGAHQWRIVRLQLVMNFRILFENKSSDSKQEYTQFTPLPVGLTYAEGIRLLRGGTASAGQAGH